MLQVFHAEEAFDVLKNDENEECLRTQTLHVCTHIRKTKGK